MLADVSTPSVDLGLDTTINIDGSVTLNSDQDFVWYLWSDGSMDVELTVDSNAYAVGTHTIWLEVTDGFGCLAEDTIIITMIDTTAQDTNTSMGAAARTQGIGLSPNPTTGLIRLAGTNGARAGITVLDSAGAVVRKEQLVGETLDLSGLPSGTYFLSIELNEGVVRRTVVVR